MTPAQRAAIYGSGNPNAPQATSQMSEREAQAKQAELAREKQHQDALDSDTVAVDFREATMPAPVAEPQAPRLSAASAKAEPDDKPESGKATSTRPEPKDAAIDKYDFD